MKRTRQLLFVFLIITLTLFLFPVIKTVADEEEPITVTVFIGDPGDIPYVNNKIYRLIEEEFGIHFEFEFLAGNLDETLDQKIQNSDYNDMFCGGNSNDMVINSGALINLLDYVSEENTPRLWEHIEKQSNWLIGEDESLYVIPNYGIFDGSEPVTSVSGPAFFIQKQVLAWAGYPTINTMDEYFNLIEQFVEANPTDENGTPYTGFSILCEDWRNYCLIYPVQFLMGRPNDGELLIDPNTEEFHTETYINKPYAKAYYQRLNDEYTKGLINRSTFTMSYSTYIDEITSGCVLGLFDQGWDFRSAAMTLADAEMYDRTYVALGLIYDEDDIAGVTMPSENWSIEEHYLTGSLPNINRGFGISVNCECPERIVAMWEELMSDEWQLILNWGIEGEDYYIDENGRLNMTAEQYANSQNSTWKLENKADALFGNSPKKQGYIQNDIQVGDKIVKAGNSWEVSKQDEIVFSQMNDYDKEFLSAYGFSKWSDFLNSPIELAPYGEGWMLDYDQVDEEHTRFLQIQDYWLPQLIMADPEEFDALWEAFVDEITPYAEVFQEYMQEQVLIEVEKNQPSVASWDMFTWSLNESGVLEIDGRGKMPETVAPWDDRKNEVLSVMVNSGVKSITAAGFRNMANMNSIVIPESVIRIEDETFSGCSALEKLEIPNGIKYIGNSFADGCDMLKNIWFMGTRDQWNQINKSDNWRLGSPENMTIHMLGSIRPYIIRCIFQFYDRNPMEDEVDDWCVQLMEGNINAAEMIYQMATSEEMHLSRASFVHALYGAMYGRNADTLGFSLVLGRLSAGASLKAIVNMMAYMNTGIADHEFQTVCYESDLPYGIISMNPLYLPSDLSQIEEEAFAGLINADAIKIPASIISIASDAFLDCPLLILFGQEGTAAEDYAMEHENCVFIPDELLK